MADTDDSGEGESASPARRNTAPRSARASNGEVVPGDKTDVDTANEPSPHARRGAEPTGLTRVKASTTPDETID
jgi:hypothetical protein